MLLLRLHMLTLQHEMRSLLHCTANMCTDLWKMKNKKRCIFLKHLLHWFNCANFSLYDMIFFSKIQLEMPIIHCIWDSNQMPKGYWKYMEKYHTTKSCVFLQALYLQCVYYCVSMQNKTCQVCTTSSFRVEKYLQQELSTIFKIQNW